MLANNTFKKVAVKAQGAGIRNASELKKGFLHVHEGVVYLLTHIQSINDEGAIAAGVPLHGMRCATYWCDASLRDSFEEIQGGMTDGAHIEIFHDAERVAAVWGSASRTRTTTTTTRAASNPTSEAFINAASAVAISDNPYVLGNYTRNEYRGFEGYHASHRVTMNTPITHYNGYRIGVELETEFQTEAARSEFTDTPRNWFFCESDSSLGGYGCEMITIPLMPEDAKDRNTWKPICDRLKGLGATSWDNGNCGLHVHIGREILGDSAVEREETLSRILPFYNLYLNDDATATKVFGRARCYHEGRHEETQEFAAVKCLGASVLKDKEISKRVGDAMKAKQNCNRYYTINTTNEHTIEFRKGRGSLSVDRIQTIITFCESVCLYCKTSEDVSELTLDGFRAWIRANVPVTNALYHYYEVIERDC